MTSLCNSKRSVLAALSLDNASSTFLLTVVFSARGATRIWGRSEERSFSAAATSSMADARVFPNFFFTCPSYWPQMPLPSTVFVGASPRFWWSRLRLPVRVRKFRRAHGRYMAPPRSLYFWDRDWPCLMTRTCAAANRFAAAVPPIPAAQLDGRYSAHPRARHNETSRR